MRKFSFLLIVAFLCFQVGNVLAQKKHTVVSGNTLSGLAKQYYNDGKKWKTIYDANKGKTLETTSVKNAEGKVVQRRIPTRLVNPNLIYPGQILMIPDVASDGMSDADFTSMIAGGTWEGLEPDGRKGNYYKFDKDGNIYFYDKDKGEFEKTEEKWKVADGNLVVTLSSGEDLMFKIDEEAAKAGMLSYGDDANTYKYKKGAPAPKIELYEVTGVVTSDGKPLSAVNVKYTKDGRSMTATTDGSGRFVIKDIPTGTRLSLSKDGYKDGSASTNKNNAVNVSLESNKPKNESREIVGRVNYVKKPGKDPKPAKKATVTLKVDGKVQVADMTVKKDGTFTFPGVKYDFGQKVEITAKMKKYKDASVMVDDKDVPKIAAPAIQLNRE